MAKFCGIVGYGVTEETAPGVNEPSIEERRYFGDVLRNTRRWESGEGLNDDLKITNRISIVADAYAYEHADAIRYVSWLGTKWKVSELDIQSPRIVLSIGGVWNGDES